MCPEPFLFGHSKSQTNQYLLSQLGPNYTKFLFLCETTLGHSLLLKKVAMATASEVPRVEMLMISGKNYDLTFLPSFSNSFKTPLGISCLNNHLGTSPICTYRTFISWTPHQCSINMQKILRRPSAMRSCLLQLIWSFMWLSLSWHTASM